MSSFTHEDYTVGWICSLPGELHAAVSMLNEKHPAVSSQLHDKNTYVPGRMADHNIVIVCLPGGQLGAISAAIVAAQMMDCLVSITIRMIVGIGSGVPSQKHDVRLGDVVVSRPGPQYGGVVHYDFGKIMEGGKFIQTGRLNAAPELQLSAVNTVRTNHGFQDNGLGRHILSIIEGCNLVSPIPDQELDRLFKLDYNHVGDISCENCELSSATSSQFP